MPVIIWVHGPTQKKFLFHSCLQEAHLIKDISVLQHKIDGDGELMGNDALGSALAEFRLELLVVALQSRRIGLGMDDDLAQRPFQIGIADFLIAAAGAFAARSSFAFDDTTVGGELLR